MSPYIFNIRRSLKPLFMPTALLKSFGSPRIQRPPKTAPQKSVVVWPFEERYVPIQWLLVENHDQRAKPSLVGCCVIRNVEQQIANNMIEDSRAAIVHRSAFGQKLFLILASPGNGLTLHPPLLLPVPRETSNSIKSPLLVN